MAMEQLVLIVFAMIFVQGLFTFVQIRNYNRRIQAMKGMGMVGIGMKKGRLVPGSIVLLAVDKQGVVVRCERMKGFSVFARFREVKELAGADLRDLKAKAVENLRYTRRGLPRPDPLLQAIEGLETRVR
jgi:glucitol operon activator protein